jgi:hypothetical protein
VSPRRSAIRRGSERNRRRAAVAAYVAAAIVAREFRDVLNGSVTYAPALLLVLGLA